MTFTYTHITENTTETTTWKVDVDNKIKVLNYECKENSTN